MTEYGIWVFILFTVLIVEEIVDDDDDDDDSMDDEEGVERDDVSADGARYGVTDDGDDLNYDMDLSRLLVLV